MVAAVSPSLSVQNIADFARRAWGSSSQPADDLAKSLGLKPKSGGAASPISSLVNPGLPREHLIGSGPELSQQQVMAISLPGMLPDNPSGKPVQLPRLYWRGLTYDIYTGHGWRTRGISLYTYKPGQGTGSIAASAQQEIVQQVTMLSSGASGRPQEGVLYAAGLPVVVNRAYRIATRSQGDVFGALVAARTYQAASLVTAAGEQQLRGAGSEYPDWVRARYLVLPDSIPERVLILARDLTAAQPTPYDRVRAIESYLRAYPYSLDLPAPPYQQDIVDYFLFDLKKGYCDYYATAMTVMARHAVAPGYRLCQRHV
jgi:hypothetical protein